MNMMFRKKEENEKKKRKKNKRKGKRGRKRRRGGGERRRRKKKKKKQTFGNEIFVFRPDETPRVIEPKLFGNGLGSLPPLLVFQLNGHQLTRINGIRLHDFDCVHHDDVVYTAIL